LEKKDKNQRTFKSLNVYLLTTIVLFSTSVTFLVTTVQLIFEYNKNLSQLENTFSLVRSSYLSSIESSLWSVNKVQLQAVIEGVLKLQDMKYVQVETKEHGIFVKAGKREEKHIISQSFPINFRYKGELRNIGTLYLDASLKGVYSRLISLCLVILVTNAIKTFLVSFFILFLVRKKVTNYLERIHNYLSAYNLNKQLIVKGIEKQKNENEITKLVHVIEKMRLSLNKQFSIIEKHSEELEKKVEEQTTELNVSNIEKTNLIRTLSHDISNPLAIIKGRSELALKNGPQKNQFREKDWQKVKRAADAMGCIITLVRELDAAASGKTDLSLRPVPIGEAFTNSEFIFEQKLKAKDLALVFTGRPELLDAEILAEPVSFSNQVINNLISNAIKFSYPGSKILFHVQEEDKILSISIHDTGPGIPPDIMENIFDPNYKTSRPGTSGEAGTGFGMLLVKNYVEKFGGTLEVDARWIEDNPEAHGTCITLRLKKVKGVENALPHTA